MTYKSAIVKLSGATNNQNLTIKIEDTPGASWSVGDPTDGQSTGLRFGTASGAIPLSSFSVNGVKMVVNTSSSGTDPVTIEISVYVYFAQAAQTITVSLTGDQNVSGTFAFTGYEAKTIDASGTLIKIPS